MKLTSHMVVHDTLQLLECGKVLVGECEPGVVQRYSLSCIG